MQQGDEQKSEKEKIKIGIDIDEVVVDFFKEYLKLFNERFEYNLFLHEIEKYGLDELTGISKKEILDLLEEFNNSEKFFEVEFIEGAEESLNVLFDEFDVSFITSRPENIKENTLNYFKKHFPKKEIKIFFSSDFWGGCKSKANICKELGIKILIEDRRKYALNCAQEGIKVLLLDKPWNKNCGHENIIRVYNWNEILNRIEELKNEFVEENKDIIEEVRRFVEEECKKPTAKYPEAYKFHFVSMHRTAKEVAEKLRANVEVVEIAAWLHDIGSIIYGRDNHHVTGSEVAEKKLRELNYPEEKIEKVKKCILNHRGSVNNPRESIEEQIIAEADTLDAFINIPKQFLATLVYEKRSLEEATKSVREKLNRKYNKLYFEESKNLIKPKYEAAMLLLKQ